MRFAVGVVALLFSHVQSQQQCADSLGACSGSRASLMQVKSLSQRMQTSTGQGTSKHAETLAGFQKYTQELVDKYLEDPKDFNQTGLGGEVLNAINIIRDYINSLYTDLKLFHDQDVKAADWCAGSAERCIDRNLNSTVISKLSTLNQTVVTKRNDHIVCRERLDTECPTPVCAYHEYRQTALLPDCVKEFRLDDTHRKAPFELGGLNSDLKHMEACLPRVDAWLDPLYGNYSECADLQSPKDCSQEQLDFERTYCESLVHRDTHCDAYDTCMLHAKDFCVDGVSAKIVATCPQIKANVGGRQASNETAEMILCLLDVLTAPDGDKAEGLQACHDADYAAMNAFWLIECDVTDEQPANGVCTRDRDGCGEEFKAIEYSTHGWVKVREADDPACCKDGDGVCRDECKIECSSTQ